ncbi:MAG: hypothetical protein ACK4WH_06620 [Phycisphaerales bacterium]
MSSVPPILAPQTDPEIQVVSEASERLGRSLSTLIGAVAEHPCRPSDLSRVLGINKDLASRVVNAVTIADPLASAYAMPGPAPLRTLVQSAKRRGAALPLIEEADSAIDAYERMLAEQVGDKTGLDALIGAWLPEAREEVDVTARQLVYRGTSLVKGLVADAAVVSFLVHRSATDPERCDTAMIGGWVGLRRLRPRIPMRFIARLVHVKGQPGPMFDAAGDQFYDRFMERFSDQPLPVTVRQSMDRREYWLDDRGVGPRSSSRVFLNEIYRSNHPFSRPIELKSPLRFFFSGIDVPVKVLVLDVLVASDVWVGRDPELRVYETAANGTADPNDLSRDIDLMAPPTAIRSLGSGIDRFRSALIPNYPEMLQSVIEAHGWRDSHFRGYRCQVEYPLYSSQVTMVFDPFGTRGAAVGDRV